MKTELVEHLQRAINLLTAEVKDKTEPNPDLLSALALVTQAAVQIVTVPGKEPSNYVH